MRLGDLELQIVPDGTFWRDGGAMFGVVPKVLWEKKLRPDERNRVPVATNCLLIKGKDFVLVVDAGLGEKWDEETREMYGIGHEATLVGSLSRHGVGPEDVDALVLSHLHFDHSGAATQIHEGRVVPAFPRASIYVQAAELDHARNPNERDRVSYRADNWEPLAAAGRLEPVSGEMEIRPGVTVVPVPGHSMGMQAVRVESQGRTAFFFSDSLPHQRPRPGPLDHGLRPLPGRAD